MITGSYKDGESFGSARDSHHAALGLRHGRTRRPRHGGSIRASLSPEHFGTAPPRVDVMMSTSHEEAAMNRRSVPVFAVASPEPISDLNTTPLIDVMLVLLIMFIITIPVTSHKVALDLPTVRRPISNRRSSARHGLGRPALLGRRRDRRGPACRSASPRCARRVPDACSTFAPTAKPAMRISTACWRRSNEPGSNARAGRQRTLRRQRVLGSGPDHRQRP